MYLDKLPPNKVGMYLRKNKSNNWHETIMLDQKETWKKCKTIKYMCNAPNVDKEDIYTLPHTGSSPFMAVTNHSLVSSKKKKKHCGIPLLLYVCV